MRLEIKINLDNAAFDDEPATEIGRILRELAESAEHGETPARNEPGAIRDVNGNTVGNWRIVGR